MHKYVCTEWDCVERENGRMGERREWKGENVRERKRMRKGGQKERKERNEREREKKMGQGENRRELGWGRIVGKGETVNGWTGREWERKRGNVKKRR